MQKDSTWEVKENAYKEEIRKLNQHKIQARKQIKRLENSIQRRKHQAKLDILFKQMVQDNSPYLYDDIIKNLTNLSPNQKKTKKYCYSCNEDTFFKELVETISLKVRGEDITFEGIIERCQICNSALGLSDENKNSPLTQTYVEYRKRHNYLTPEQMKEFRKSLKMTPKEMSLWLGWEEKTITRYEQGALQTEHHDIVFKYIMEELKTKGIVSTDLIPQNLKTESVKHE